ncbi:hypothetical protein [Polyangium sp. 15x6]|uniref:hypothetical protein n=1 Tax=Polyangium sp. 15x6 TaxID=3042687 RepID=UPI00249B1CB5|nr:hypothetical protein [Polyangium sp. 15x6]MDI3284061.1 hypothetical protein [Polyangium sp. 15x6]
MSPSNVTSVERTGDPADGSGSGLGERLGDLFAALGAGGDVLPPATSGLEEHGGSVAITIGLDDEGFRSRSKEGARRGDSASRPRSAITHPCRPLQR